MKHRIADMVQGFDNIRARRLPPDEKMRELVGHATKYHKLNHKLFRLRQAALAFDPRKTDG